MYAIYWPNTRLWWNDEIGWTHEAGRSIYTPRERHYMRLPLEGRWVGPLNA